MIELGCESAPPSLFDSIVYHEIGRTLSAFDCLTLILIFLSLSLPSLTFALSLVICQLLASWNWNE